MTEEPKVFGDAPPFTLVHGDDLNEVARFLADRGVKFNQTTSAPSLYKLQFMQERAETIQKLMRELFAGSVKVNRGSARKK
ncbi:MAG TPA: hypothetical protein VM008_03300 [Phycisphaerae bacterium]|nr:hypothetical protein [Phycisphaerae bacterium]